MGYYDRKYPVILIVLIAIASIALVIGISAVVAMRVYSIHLPLQQVNFDNTDQYSEDSESEILFESTDLYNKFLSLEEKVADMSYTNYSGPLAGKKIVYDGDSIVASRDCNGGGYAAMIASLTSGSFDNQAAGGARLCASEDTHSVVNNLENLPLDGDLYCFEGGINDYWGNTPLGECDPADYLGAVDPTTICGAMETIFRYCQEHFPDKPVCFVIVHKVKKTAYRANENGDTFEDYRNAMIRVCEKYSVPYYDAFSESGLNGWNEAQSNLFLTGNSDGMADGIHPNEDGYKHYYVPQLLSLFERIMPVT